MSVNDVEDRLTLEVADGIKLPHESERDVRRIHFYTSSLTDNEDRPLLSVANMARGTRLTIEQVTELRDWLNIWLGEHT